MNSAGKLLEKFRPGGCAVKEDWWSNTLSSGFNAIGITSDVRDSLQPTVDHAVSLLPKGGAVPATESPIGSVPQATGFRYSGNISPGLMIGVVGGVLALAIFLKRK